MSRCNASREKSHISVRRQERLVKAMPVPLRSKLEAMYRMRGMAVAPTARTRMEILFGEPM
ncbi:hypothetical protein APSETT445_001610 [Aspergillus pseudonomiae]